MKNTMLRLRIVFISFLFLISSFGQYSLDFFLRNARDVIAVLEQQLELTGEMMKKGYGNARDFLLLQIEVKNQAMALRDAGQQYKNDVMQLYAICGIRDTAMVEISPVVLEKSPPVMKSNFTQRTFIDSLTAGAV